MSTVAHAFVDIVFPDVAYQWQISFINLSYEEEAAANLHMGSDGLIHQNL